MIMYDQHSEVVRWGLNLLGGDPFSNLGYYETASRNDAIYYNEHYAREDNIDTEHTVVENDEIIAHALQEEFSQLAVAEASRPSHGDQQHSQASVLAQNWLGPSLRTCHSDNEVCWEEGGDMEPSATSTRHSENYYGGGEWSLELADDYSAIDGEVGKRLHQMVAVPHVPRINGEIPSVDEATSDHQRLLDRLRLYDLVELKVLGDGNCQFRALSDQFYRTPEHHNFVRQQVVNQLKKNRDLYEGYIPMAFDDYLEKLSNDGEWGDHVTLQAAADSYGVKIFVITSFKDTCYTEIIPNFPKSNRVIFLSFWAEVHYNSIYPEGDFPTLESKKKKKWWWFGNNE